MVIQNPNATIVLIQNLKRTINVLIAIKNVIHVLDHKMANVYHVQFNKGIYLKINVQKLVQILTMPLK